MPNLASTLKAEISRLARKEIRAEVAHIKKIASQHRSTIAALRREVSALRKQMRGAIKGQSPTPARGEAPVRHRFRAQGLVKHRKKLGLSAQDYGKLVGVSGLSIYKWEKGSHPRAKQLESLAAIRGVGKREALQRLQEIDAAEVKPALKRRRAVPVKKTAGRKSTRARA